MIVLAGVGVIADVTPVTGQLYAKFAKVFKPSKLTTKGVSNALEQAIKEGVDATKSVDGIATDLDTLAGKIAKGIGECGAECNDRVEAAVKVYADELRLDSKTNLGKVNTDFQDPRYDVLNLTALDRIADIEASVYCVARKLASGVSASLGIDRARTIPKNLCPTTITKNAVGLVTQVKATLDLAFINGGTNPSKAARKQVIADGAKDASGNVLDDAGHILAYLLGGGGGLRSDNIVAIRSTVNQVDIRRLELEIANSVRAGNSVSITVNLRYAGPILPRRPVELEYIVTTNGVTAPPVIFANPSN